MPHPAAGGDRYFIRQKRRSVVQKDNNKTHVFWGWEKAGEVTAEKPLYTGIETPLDFYDVLTEIWCAETCAPRLRDGWTMDSRTLGQCSITAFLAQDIFGGDVYGVPRPGGTFHCFNKVGDIAFDLTSEQFGEEKLCYENCPKQFREEHFAKEEKKQRYALLKRKLQERCGLEVFDP